MGVLLVNESVFVFVLVRGRENVTVWVYGEMGVGVSACFLVLCTQKLLPFTLYFKDL